MIVKSIVSVREVKIRISTFMLAGVKEDARLPAPISVWCWSVVRTEDLSAFLLRIKSLRELKRSDCLGVDARLGHRDCSSCWMPVSIDMPRRGMHACMKVVKNACPDGMEGEMSPSITGTRPERIFLSMPLYIRETQIQIHTKRHRHEHCCAQLSCSGASSG